MYELLTKTNVKDDHCQWLWFLFGRKRSRARHGFWYHCTRMVLVLILSRDYIGPGGCELGSWSLWASLFSLGSRNIINWRNSAISLKNRPFKDNYSDIGRFRLKVISSKTPFLVPSNSYGFSHDFICGLPEPIYVKSGFISISSLQKFD